MSFTGAAATGDAGRLRLAWTLRNGKAHSMRTKARLALEVVVNGKRRTLAVLRGKGVVQAWIVAERLDVPDRVTLQLTALDTTDPGTDTFSRWRKVKLPVGS